MLVHTTAVTVLWLAVAGMQDRPRLRGSASRYFSKCTTWVIKEGATVGLVSCIPFLGGYMLACPLTTHSQSPN